ncbi:DUF3320 domain-containing protein [Paracoccus sp. S-4012]|uniref:DUF3320 domain-containing protein n=1 Tax=Paracoccus sp. S-4012 TaxID=2665648 RepID=UPI0018A23F31|nr:DUF3320 domain-containing protein [Paracoccus sp. S-4012]
MNDDNLIWNSLSRQEKESLARYGLATKNRRRDANQRSRERKRHAGLVRMEVDVRPEHRPDLRLLIELYVAARRTGDALQVTRVPMPALDGSAVLAAAANGYSQFDARSNGRAGPAENSPPAPHRAEPGRDQAELAGSQEVFFSDGYSIRLNSIIAEIIRTDAPLPLDLLRRKVARLHGWHRAGGLIAARIDACLGAAEIHEEDGTAFVWEPGAYTSRVPYRVRPERDIREISRHEFADLLDQHAAALIRAADPLRECARLAGVGRLTPAIREYLEGCLAWWRANPS